MLPKLARAENGWPRQEYAHYCRSPPSRNQTSPCPSTTVQAVPPYRIFCKTEIMRQLHVLCVVFTALLCAGTVLAQSGDDNNGNVLYVQTDNYVVHTYGEYTNPVIEYW